MHRLVRRVAKVGVPVLFRKRLWLSDVRGDTARDRSLGNGATDAAFAVVCSVAFLRCRNDQRDHRIECRACSRATKTWLLRGRRLAESLGGVELPRGFRKDGVMPKGMPTCFRSGEFSANSPSLMRP